MADEHLTAWGIRYREEERQRYLCEVIKVAFRELATDTKFRLINELTKDKDMIDHEIFEDYTSLYVDSIIEPCPYCGSHDLYFKVKQEYRDMIRPKRNSKWSLKYNIVETEHYKLPIRATGTFMCGCCKAKFRDIARRVPELYVHWNEFARKKRKW